MGTLKETFSKMLFEKLGVVSTPLKCLWKWFYSIGDGN
jgi:hypothetical protein